MTVFKTFFKIMSKNIGTIILYTVMLVLFGGMQYSNNQTIGFAYEKPDVIILNEDNSLLANNLVEYFKNNADLIEDYKSIDDALFYRQANYVIYIYEGYGSDVLNNKFTKLDIKSTGDYMSSLASMMLNRYLNIQDKYISLKDEKLINEKVNNIINKKTNIEVKSKINTNELNKVATYYNFASYTIMAVIILVITLILSSYNNINIRKRTIISSKNYKLYNSQLLKASSVYALLAWIFYNLLAIVLNGSTIFSIRGLLFMGNSLLFTIIALALAILISNLINNKNAINGIVNVLAIGSSFLCGVFVPAEWLGNTVLKIAHIFPTYYYVNSNNLISSLENINLESLKPVIQNSLILIIFIIGLIIVNNIITKYKRKIG